MPDTGERREITRFVNAKEAETIQHAKKIVSTTKQQSSKAGQEDRSRKVRKVAPPRDQAKPVKATQSRQDREASERMVNEGGPNLKP